MEMSFSLKSAS